MIKKSFLVILLFVLATALVQGMPTFSRGRCLCEGKGAMMSSVPIRRIAEVKFHRRSSSCDQEELVVIFQGNGRSRCLDIKMEQGQRIKQAILKKRK
ncbi:C-X-C motif chemokine 11 [Rhineura floridana]|uniref:C-X-C motif chemokine 11 n=1 Tax=Rhineura floridana TaxID=261503 RepID=UPI002AC7FED8|nr:C-X-C motif chemokine 11 [Rhineura floridana]